MILPVVGTVAFAAIAFFICLIEIFIFFRIDKGSSFPFMLISAFLVFLYFIINSFNQAFIDFGEMPLIFLRTELLLIQTILVGFILVLGSRAFLYQRLFTLSGLVIIGLIFLVALFMPGDLLFGYISSGGKFIQPFTGGKDFGSSGVTLWRILLSFSILVFIPCSVYMAARKTQPELKKYLWMVYASLALILLSALNDYLADAQIFLSPVTLPYLLFLYLIVLYIVQIDAYLADYSEKREKFIRNEQFIYSLNQANVIVVFLNRMGHVDYINPYFLKLTGYEIQEVKGNDWFEFFLPPKDYYEVQSAFIEILEFDFHPRYSNPVISKDGREIPVDWYNVRLRDDSGNIYGSLSIGIDRPPAR